MVQHLINHHSQSNSYLIKIMPDEKPVLYFFKFLIKLFKRIHQKSNIRATLSWPLLWSYCHGLKRQMLTEIFIRNLSEKVRSSCWLFCKVSFKYLKRARQFLWKILIGCTLIILRMIFSKGSTCILLYSKHISRKS